MPNCYWMSWHRNDGFWLTALAMVFKLCQSARKKWRCLKPASPTLDNGSAAMDLACLPSDAVQHTAAFEWLVSIYDGFTGGFDTLS